MHGGFAAPDLRGHGLGDDAAVFHDVTETRLAAFILPDRVRADEAGAARAGILRRAKRQCVGCETSHRELRNQSANPVSGGSRAPFAPSCCDGMPAGLRSPAPRHACNQKRKEPCSAVRSTALDCRAVSRRGIREALLQRFRLAAVLRAVLALVTAALLALFLATTLAGLGSAHGKREQGRGEDDLDDVHGLFCFRFVFVLAVARREQFTQRRRGDYTAGAPVQVEQFAPAGLFRCG